MGRSEADVEADEDIAVYSSQTPLVDKGKGRDTLAPSALPAPGVTGSISGSNARSKSAFRQTIGGVSLESRYTGNSSGTLDEPLSATLMRDLNAIKTKVIVVLWPVAGTDRAPLREWDLWGPLIFCLALAVMLSLGASDDQSLSVFTGVFVIVTVGSVVVTVNAKLLGGKVSFFQSLCVLGYCLAPLDIAALVTLFFRLLIIRIPIVLAGFGWAAYAAVNFLGGTRLEDSRALLAVYPCYLLFFLISWITLLS